MAFAVLLAVCLLRQFWVADGADFLFPAKELTSFTFGARRIKIWALEDNFNKSSADWQFRYQPFLSPVFDQETNKIIEVVQVGSKWYTEFIVTLEDVDVNTKAFEAIQKVYKNVSDLDEDNVFPLGVRSIKITLPDLRTEFQNVKLLQLYLPCPDGSTCFKVSTELEFRITLVSLNRETALKAKDFLERTNMKYEIVLSSDALLTKDLGELELNNVLNLSTTSGVPSRQSSKNFIQKELERKFQISRTDLLNVIKEEINNKTLPLIEKTDELSYNQKKMELGIADTTDELRSFKTNIAENVGNLTGCFTELKTQLAHHNTTLQQQSGELMNLKTNLTRRFDHLANSTNTLADEVKNLKQSSKECTGNWRKFCLGGRCHCYLLITNTMTWTSAKQSCRNLQADLVSIHTREEDTFVRSMTSSTVWTGLSQENDRRSSQWSDGTALTYMVLEYKPKEHLKSYYYCAQLDLSSSSSWPLSRCSNEYPAICKKPL